MDDWITSDRIRAILMIVTFIGGIAGWTDSYLETQERKATQKQVTSITNYYYQECK